VTVTPSRLPIWLPTAFNVVVGRGAADVIIFPHWQLLLQQGNFFGQYGNQQKEDTHNDQQSKNLNQDHRKRLGQKSKPLLQAHHSGVQGVSQNGRHHERH
jgi:hypothetical protein